MTKTTVKLELNNKISDFFTVNTLEEKIRLRSEIYSTMQTLPFSSEDSDTLQKILKHSIIETDIYLMSGNQDNESIVKQDFLSLIIFVELSLLDD